MKVKSFFQGKIFETCDLAFTRRNVLGYRDHRLKILSNSTRNAQSSPIRGLQDRSS